MSLFAHKRNEHPVVSLALQGGGAHGAFTWGVLDALLEDGRIAIDGISGTSAGAMNAAVLAHGWAGGGRAGARAALAHFWEAVAARLPAGIAAAHDTPGLTPAARLLLQFTRHFSPYQLNPLGFNPLREVIETQIDFERLRRASPLRLFIAATEANSGRLRLFREHELTADMLLASACLPTLHHAIEIAGEPYWDGGFAANPAVEPLFYQCRANDVLLVLLAPLRHVRTPRSADEIHTRALEIGFSASFLCEMRAIAQAAEYARGSWWPRGRLERRLAATRFHVIEAQDLMQQLSAESKLLAHLPFLHMLRDQGRQRAASWLARHYRNLGHSSSADLSELFR